jgi:hypothetical protein
LSVIKLDAERKVKKSKKKLQMAYTFANYGGEIHKPVLPSK